MCSRDAGLRRPVSGESLADVICITHKRDLCNIAARANAIHLRVQSLHDADIPNQQRRHEEGL